MIATDLGSDIRRSLGRRYTKSQDATVQRLGNTRSGNELTIDDQRQHVADVLAAHLVQFTGTGLCEAQTHEILSLTIDQGSGFAQIRAREHRLTLDEQ